MLERLDFIGRYLRARRELEYYVLGSGISSSIDRYIMLSKMNIYLLMLLSGIVTFIVTCNRLPILISVGVSLYITFLIIMPLALALTMAIPNIVYRHRSSVLESKFMILALYLSSIVAGGADLSKAFVELAKMANGPLKPFSLELRIIVSRLNIGEPIDRALEYASRITPSPSLRELFQALAAGSRIGVAILNIIDAVVSGYLNRFSIYLEKETNSLAILLDSYTVIAMTTPIIVGTIALLFSFIGGFYQYLQMVMFLSFIFLPLASLVTLVIADTIASRLRL